MPSLKNIQLTEAEVVRLWQEQMQRQRLLADSEGNLIEVLYPGRLNDSRGGDFRDALVASGRGHQNGSIEIHIRTSGWQSHGHHRDPVYNQVILHVALEQDRAGKTMLENGQAVPTVILGRYVHPESSNPLPGSAWPCQGTALKWDPENLIQALDQAGESRLELRAARYQKDWSPAEAGQRFYEGLLEALGYAKNKLPFLELAGRAPLKRLEDMIHRENAAESGLIRMQALLLGMAGLLPSQRSPDYMRTEYTDHLESEWSQLAPVSAPPYPHWELFKVRPGNYPVRRIAALSHWLYRYRESGITSALLDLVRRTPCGPAHIALESALFVTAEGYWADHYNFGLPHPEAGPVVLGRERAAEIIINVVLPFSLAWSRMSADPELGSRAREIYAHYPRLEINSLERHMLNQLALRPRQINSARRQQGLIHIYQTLCTRGKCGECFLNGP